MPLAIPVPLRRLIWRQLQRGHSAAAIARALNLPPSTVRGLARRFRGHGPSAVVPDYHGGPKRASRPPPLADEAVRLRQELSAERLADALRAAVGDPAIRRRAAALGERIRAEDGVARAVQFFKDWPEPRRAAPRKARALPVPAV